jgi:hypothetical protein
MPRIRSTEVLDYAGARLTLPTDLRSLLDQTLITSRSDQNFG